MVSSDSLLLFYARCVNEVRNRVAGGAVRCVFSALREILCGGGPEFGGGGVGGSGIADYSMMGREYSRGAEFLSLLLRR